MTSEVVSPNNQAFTSMLRGKPLKIYTYGALIQNEVTTIITITIIDHNSVCI